MRTVRFYPEAWPLHSAFVISRGSRTEAKVIVVEIEENDIHAFGECTPYPHYGESESSVMAQLALVAMLLRMASRGKPYSHFYRPERRGMPSILRYGNWSVCNISKVYGNEAR